MTESMVEVRDLRKTFAKKSPPRTGPLWARLMPRGRQPGEEFVAVDCVNFAIARGEIFGLLGPNGAGKTTTIRMLCTLLEPTSGTATIASFDVRRQPSLVRQSLGAVLTGERSVYWKLTARENLRYFAALYHIPPAAAKKRVDELLERLDLAKRADDLVERFSSGMKQRVAIAKALLANPPVLLLDEPTIGLDPQSARNLRELILEIKTEGRTILLTTHYMEEADQLCDRIGIIDQGKIIALDTPAALKRSLHQLEHVELELEQLDPRLACAVHALPSVERVIAHSPDRDGTASLTVHTADGRQLLPELIELVGSYAGRIRNLRATEPTLEDVFITLTGNQLRD